MRMCVLLTIHMYTEAHAARRVPLIKVARQRRYFRSILCVRVMTYCTLASAVRSRKSPQTWQKTKSMKIDGLPQCSSESGK